jgi:hypothetical protein
MLRHDAASGLAAVNFEAGDHLEDHSICNFSRLDIGKIYTPLCKLPPIHPIGWQFTFQDNRMKA